MKADTGGIGEQRNYIAKRRELQGCQDRWGLPSAKRLFDDPGFQVQPLYFLMSETPIFKNALPIAAECAFTYIEHRFGAAGMRHPA